MASILADIGTAVGGEIRDLSSRIADAEEKNTTQDTSLLNLSIRLSSAEDSIVALGGQEPPPTGDFTIAPVQWTNLTEINLSGEKLLNTDFDLPALGLGVEVVVLTSWSNGGKTAQVGEVYEIDLVQDNGGMRLANSTQNIFASAAQMQNNVQPNTPEYWSVNSAVDLDQDKLAQGIIKGDGGAVSIQQTFSSPIPSGTKLVAKVTRVDTHENGTVHVQRLRANGSPYGDSQNIPYASGFVEFETTETTYGLRLSTSHGTREVSSISLFQGSHSGGTVQANGNGGLEKIAGTDGFNSGASSTNFIEGNSNGYVQFQWGAEFKSQRIGLTYQDVDFTNINPFQVTINGNGHVFTNGSNAFSGGDGYASQGDFFRIRHYASTNQVHFQKRQAVYGDDTDFCLLQSCGLQPNGGHASNHTFAVADRPLILAKQSVNGLTQGEYYRIHQANTSSGNTRIYTLEGVQIGWMTGRGINWEVQKEIGEDYVTFHIHSDTTNGNNLYVDTSLFHVGSRLNDVLLAR